MRKHLSRVMAALLVLAMALTMLPAVSAAKERFTATPIDGIPESGQSFVIYSAPAGGVFSPEASGGAVGVSAAFGSEESANLTVQTGAGAYQAVKNADGTYYLTCGGQYLTVDSAEKLTFENEPQSGSSKSSKVEDRRRRQGLRRLLHRQRRGQVQQLRDLPGVLYLLQGLDVQPEQERLEHLRLPLLLRGRHGGPGQRRLHRHAPRGR